MNTNIYKSHFKILLVTVLVLSFSMSGLYAQNNSKNKNRERLIGTWTLDYNKSISQINSKAKIYHDSLKQEKKNFIKTSFSSRKMTFKKEGGYTLEIRHGKIKRGTWELLEDQTTLVLQMDDEKRYEQHIEKISTSTMTLNLGGDQSKGQLFQKWYLKKLTN